MKLRPYQSDIKKVINYGWENGNKNMLAVLPTGAGKTITFSDIIHDHNGASCAIAHRQELVSQISLALARDKVRHHIIGPKNVVKLCVSQHMQELGHSYYDPSSKCAVASVDTLVRRGKELDSWLKSVTLWVQDEAHHVLVANKWGKAASMFPNAKGLGVTATPLREDGKGLGRIADGLFDCMVEGPSMRDLINMGYLTDYRVFAPPSDLDLSSVNISQATGDYNPVKLRAAVEKSHIIGDVVTHYIRIAKGKLGVTFVPSVEIARRTAEEFNADGVPAEVVSANTPDNERINILKRFKNRELLQLVNVDLFGEGFDLPAIEVVSMARPTQSYALYVQQFGRALRLMIDYMDNYDQLTDEQRREVISLSKKPHAIIIDHVGNIEQKNGRGHGLPDAKRSWSLKRREKRAKKSEDDVIPVKACPECTAVYERIHNVCPFCGHKPIPAARNSPEFVDGDLIELDPAALAEMRGEVARVDMSLDEKRAELLSKHVPDIGVRSLLKKHTQLQESQEALRASMAWWGGYQRSKGREDSEIYRRFYFTFGIDMMSAQALKTMDALELAERINYKLGEMG